MISVILYKDRRIYCQYLLLSFGALCICVGGVILPYFSSALNTSRLYQISLIFLAPFCILGGIWALRIIIDFVNVSGRGQHVKHSLQALSVFFALFLLFNSGWIFEIAQDQPSALLNNTIDFPIVNEREVAGGRWLTGIHDDRMIYADDNRLRFLNRFNSTQKTGYLPPDAQEISDNSYIFLGNFNIHSNSVILVYQEKAITYREYVDPGRILMNRSRIYDVGSAEVYFS